MSTTVTEAPPEDKDYENIWKYSNFAGIEEIKSKEAKRNTIATFFFNLSVAAFAGMVIGIIMQAQDSVLSLKVVTIAVIGLIITIAFAWIGYEIVKI